MSLLEPDNPIDMFRLNQLKYALKIEIDTGLRFSRGSVLKFVNQQMGWSHRTKKAAYEGLCEHIRRIEDDERLRWHL